MGSYLQRIKIVVKKGKCTHLVRTGQGGLSLCFFFPNYTDFVCYGVSKFLDKVFDKFSLSISFQLLL